MKRKIRLFTLLLAFAACLCLSACGEPANTGNPNAGAGGQQPGGSEQQESDWAYIEGKGELVVGITIYEPMSFYGADGALTGFDTEFTQAVCEKLGVTPNFVVINWDTKEVELAAKSIDCVWNGLTITPSRAAEMSISLPYVKNAQVVVVKAGSDIASTEDLVGKTVVAEVGSAGEAQIKGEEPDEFLAQAEYIAMSKQTDCLMEVKAGTADAAVLDWTLAMSMVGAGTDYADLTMVAGLELAVEEYGVAFRNGSDVTERVNEIMLQLAADGSLEALAEKYGLILAPALSE